MPNRQVNSFTYPKNDGGDYVNEAAARSAANAKKAQTPGALPMLQKGRVCPKKGNYNCNDEVQAWQVVVPASGGRKTRKGRAGARKTRSNRSSRK